MAKANATIKALRGLLRDPKIPAKEMKRHFKELTGTNDRLVAVVCGSLVENAVQGLLESVMANGPGNLFDPHQPLSTLSAKINISYSLAMIDSEIRRNLDYIREIRNDSRTE